MTVETPEWVKDAVFYQIFPDRFARSDEVFKPANLETWGASPTIHGFKGGDLMGVLEHLDYLEELGINAIYFNPIFQSAANHRYHTYDYFQVDPILGGNEAFRKLLDAAHARGMRVILDGVFNHASRGFFQFNHIMENGPASPYINWFNVKGFPLYAFDGEEEQNYEAWFNLRELPKLNTDHLPVQEFIYEVAEYWLNFGMDGWRLDVPLDVKTPGFWEEFRRRVKGVNPEAYILAEIWEEARPWLEGKTFDAVMNYPFNRACLGFFGGPALNIKERPGGFRLERMNAEEFGFRIERLLDLYDWEVSQVLYNLLSSHDEPRFLTLVHEDTRRLKLATLFQMAYPGAPGIYYGDEIGVLGGHDPDSRRGFPWDRRLWDEELLAAFRRFVALRKEHVALRRGRYVSLHAEGQVYAFARTSEEETLVVVLNAGEGEATVELDLAPLEVPADALEDVWGDERLEVRSGNPATITVGPVEGRVFRL